MVTAKPAWHQLPDETDTAYHRFSIYLELGPDRSLEKARQKIGKSSGYLRQLQTWSSKYDWVRRAGEFDNHLIRKSLKNKEKILDEVNGKLLNAASKAADELIDIALHKGKEKLGEREISLMNQKIKAIDSLLDRVGIVRQKERADPEKPTEVNNYIQNIYKRIEASSKEWDQK